MKEITPIKINKTLVHYIVLVLFEDNRKWEVYACVTDLDEAATYAKKATCIRTDKEPVATKILSVDLPITNYVEKTDE